VSFLLLENISKKNIVNNQKLSAQFPPNLSGINQNALPAQQTMPAQTYASPANAWKAPNTGELSQPRSVTEGTTKLLEKDR
jgi:hypothetical protein